MSELSIDEQLLIFRAAVAAGGAQHLLVPLACFLDIRDGDHRLAVAWTGQFPWPWTEARRDARRLACTNRTSRQVIQPQPSCPCLPLAELAAFYGSLMRQATSTSHFAGSGSVAGLVR